MLAARAGTKGTSMSLPPPPSAFPTSNSLRSWNVGKVSWKGVGRGVGRPPHTHLGCNWEGCCATTAAPPRTRPSAEVARHEAARCRDAAAAGRNFQR
jgi:hypothetical protein